MTGPKTRRIVLLGKTGTGKSSLVNTLFGEEVFKVGHGPNSETKRCKPKTGFVNGRQINLIDTPGFFDTDTPEEEMKSEIVRCITEFSPGPHAFLLVLKVEKYTTHEKDVIAEICKYLSEEVLKYATVLFTHGDQLPEGQTIKDFVRQNKSVSDLVEKCGGRCHVIDNKYWDEHPDDKYRSNRFQVEELLKTIDETVEANQGGCYTNAMLQAVEEEKQKEIELIGQTAGNMSEEEISEKAKVSVFKKILIRTASITSGALMGALFGVVAVAAGVCAVLQLYSEFAASGLSLKMITGGAIGTTTAAASGGPAAAGVVVAANVVITITIAVAATGAVIGSYIGYKAAEGASTTGEAAKRTQENIMDIVQKLREKATYHIETWKKENAHTHTHKIS